MLRSSRRVRSAGFTLAALAFLSALAMNAGAQPNPIIFDGNLIWNNGPGGTTQWLGGISPAGVCNPGFDDSTKFIATVQYPNNSVADPLLSGAISNTTNPNWRPAAGSPAFCGNAGHGKVVQTPADGFFTRVPWVGAMGPTEQDWTAGWTYYSLDGAGRTDLQPLRPLVILVNQNLYSNRAFSADSNYLVRGQLRVKSQATLTIPAGVVIFEETSTAGTIIIERGAKIQAVGTVTSPIIITSDQAPGSQAPGGGGGIFIHGRARVNAANSCAGDSAASEGGAVGFYGGNDDTDNSGTLRYVRVEFAGVLVTANNEANSITLNGVGSGTTLDHLQAHRGLDDLFEFFGGTAQAKYLVGTYGDDDGFDWQMGYRGKAQFVAIRQLAIQTGAERGIEADNNEFSNDTEICSGRSNPTLSNFTLIGDRRSGAGFAGVKSGIVLRRGTGGTILNSIITEWKTSALDIQTAATFTNHCTDRAFAVAPGIFCSAGTTGVPELEGRVFVAQGFPNPFRKNVAIRFALARAGDVAVDIYSASGRHVRRLASGPFAAGEHTINWNTERSLPSGVYFYKVRAAGEESTGKLIRVE